MDYTSEEQQIEAIRKWWKQNGNNVLMGIAAAIAAVLGWQAWNQNQQANVEEAAALYGQVLESATLVQQSRAESKEKALEEQLSTLFHLGEQVKSDFADSEYAVFAAMMMAREQVYSGQLDEAATELTWALDNADNEALKLIVNLRLARVLVAQEQYDKALSQLDSLASASQEDAYAEVRGDIYLAKGDEKQALEAYKQAMTLNEARQGRVRPILKTKHDNLLVAED